MTIAYWCLVLAIMMPVLLTGIAKIGSGRYGRRANSNPRDWQKTQLKGWGERVHNAHLNSFEALPGFAAAVIVAHQLGAPQDKVDMLAAAFIGFRILYAIAYAKDWARLRSLVWTLAFACMVWLFIASA